MEQVPLCATEYCYAGCAVSWKRLKDSSSKTLFEKLCRSRNEAPVLRVEIITLDQFREGV